MIFKLIGIDSIPQAQELVGSEVIIPEELFENLEEGNFYSFEIIGCDVYLENKQKIGEVKDILSIPENDLLVVQIDQQEVFIPFTKEICLDVNIEKKKIIINPPDGLLQLDEI